MDYAIQLLEKEKKMLESIIREQNLMQKNMKQAACYMKNISELKQAVKVLKTKSRLTAGRKDSLF